jgi:hypothetical protein
MESVTTRRITSRQFDDARDAIHRAKPALSLTLPQTRD